MGDLHAMFPPPSARFLSSLRAPDRYLTVERCRARIAAWGRRGATVKLLGHSRSGMPIEAAVIGDGPYTLLAWGYPHPDEPVGASALAALGDALLAGRLSDLSHWRFVLILCPDPDQVARNRRFLCGDGSLTSFLEGSWRPLESGLEVDYGFPLTYGPFLSTAAFIGRCRSQAECRILCGERCTRRNLPFAPLPESRALAFALELYRPQLVASMHNAVASGDYTFLLQRVSTQVADDLLALPACFGQPRHLGEPIDRGRRWRRDSPDLIREERLAQTLRWLRGQEGFVPDRYYEDSHSASNFIEATLPGCQFVCPEIGLFRHPALADVRPWPRWEQVEVAVEQRAGGRYRLTRAFLGGRWRVIEQERTEDPVSGPVRLRRAQTRASLGMRALFERRRVLRQADELWERVLELPALVAHPYLDERWQLGRPLHRTLEGAARIFRLDPSYHRRATVAQAVSFRWLWPLQTAALLANFQNFLAVQDLERPELAAAKRELSALQERCLRGLPEELHREGDRGQAMASQLARVLRLAHERAPQERS
jgi:hypothetical protein